MRTPKLHILLIFIIGLATAVIFRNLRKYGSFGWSTSEEDMLQPQQPAAVDISPNGASQAITNIIDTSSSNDSVSTSKMTRMVANEFITSTTKTNTSGSVAISRDDAVFSPDEIKLPVEVPSNTSSMHVTPMTTQSIGAEEYFRKIIQETTRILYRDSPHLDQWLAMPPPKVYVYDTIDHDYSNMEDVSACVNLRLMRIGAPAMKKRNICPWDPKDYCEDNLRPNNGGENRYLHYRSNYNNDIALIRWFQNYPLRTTDPKDADFFIVPYPHKSHCLCKLGTERTTKCSYGIDHIQENIIDKLEFYEQQKERHLFFLGVDWPMAHRQIRNEVKLSLSLGPSNNCVNTVNGSCGHFVTPYLSIAPEYAVPRKLEWFTDRPRYYSLGAAFGTPKALSLRRTFVANQTQILGSNIGGMPHQIIDFGNLRHFIRQDDIITLYRNSTFCPILPGDNCPQKRFFEVILNGCIPVVPQFEASNEAGFPTFYRFSGLCSIRTTYPFAAGTFLNDMKAGINYMDLVVPFDGLCGLDCMKPAMEKVLANATELHRLRSNLHAFSKLFRFGLGEDSYQAMDAFTAITVSLRHYVRGLNNSLPS
jgi:hypothetical protein